MVRAAREGLGDRFRPEALGQDLMEVYDQAMSGGRWAGSLGSSANGTGPKRVDGEST
jgi:hypothetical protein